MYTYRTSRFTIALNVVGVAIIAFVGVLFGVRESIPGSSIFLAMWILLLVLACYWYLTTPFQVTFAHPDILVFRSVLRRREFTALDIQAIIQKPWSANLVTFRTIRGTIRLLTPIDQFHDLLWKVKAANPQVEIKGL